MKCSECSAPIDPVIAIDIDGTLGDYHTHFVEFAACWLNKWPSYMWDYRGQMPHGDWFTRVFNVDRTTFRAIKLAYRQGGQKRLMPIAPYAFEFMSAAHRLGCETWITTTRPWERFDRVDPDSRHWLEKHHIPYQVLMFDEDKMGQLWRRVDPARVVMVLDDQDDVLSEAAELFGRGVPVMMEGPHNEDAAWPYCRVPDFPRALSVLTTRIMNWRHHAK